MASSKKVGFWEKVLPQAAKLPGTSGFFKGKIDFLKKNSAAGSEAAPDKLLRLQKKSNFWNKNLPQAAKLPGTSGLFKKKVRFLRKKTAPGSEAAQDKWLVQKKTFF